MSKDNNLFFNRDISWLAFNHRVLQEADDPSVPLYERIKFLAIYSSNFDEFFRVRVAAIRNLIRLKKKTKKELEFPPEELLKNILRIVDKQQNEFGNIFRNKLIPELEKHNIFLINENSLNKDQVDFVKDYFQKEVKHLLQPNMIKMDKQSPFLVNKQLYFIVQLKDKTKLELKETFKYAILDIPTNQLDRFILLPTTNNKNYIIFLDDIIKCCIDDLALFKNFIVLGCYALKLTRDAQLYLEDEFSGDLVKKIEKSLSKRDTGVGSRFLYDESMPKSSLDQIKKIFALKKEDLIPGARYHNFNDFFGFPNPGKDRLNYDAMPPLSHQTMKNAKSIFKAVSKKDLILHFPYQSYDYVVKFLKEAAKDPDVISIKITLYRVADDSKVAKALIEAAKNGKLVMVFVEIKARFDEESNLYWAKEFEKAGVNVLYSFPKFKVHSKIFLISRREKNKLRQYAYLGTGNFNEKTSKIYCDHGLLTNDKRLTQEVDQVFDSLEYKDLRPSYDHLLVAPRGLRKGFIKLIKKEIKNAHAGKKAYMILKMNGLEDKKIIKKLYEASNAGVKINLIVRGICCLIPGVKGLSHNIKIVSIVDRFLEHARVFIFCNDGNEKIYVASADWMKRNLSARVEVAFPIYHEQVKKELRHLIDLQLNDNTKSRKINKSQDNNYKKTSNGKKVRSQLDTYNYLNAMVSKEKVDLAVEKTKIEL